MRSGRRRGWPLAAALLAGAAIALLPPLALGARSWRARVAVEGHSMEPTLRGGDWLLVDPHAYQHRPPGAGELVVVSDPRAPGRLLVKRVGAVDRDGRLALGGDHPGHAAEPGLEAVPAALLVGRPWLRYWPPRRIGRLS